MNGVSQGVGGKRGESGGEGVREHVDMSAMNSYSQSGTFLPSFCMQHL